MMIVAVLLEETLVTVMCVCVWTGKKEKEKSRMMLLI